MISLTTNTDLDTNLASLQNVFSQGDLWDIQHYQKYPEGYMDIIRQQCAQDQVRKGFAMIS